MGITIPKDIEQLEDLDYSTRNAIWNYLYESSIKDYSSGQYSQLSNSKTIRELYRCTWKDFFVLAVDLFDKTVLLERIRDMVFRGSWYELYNYFEFILTIYSDNEKSQFVKEMNVIFERELVGYRIINYKVTQLTSQSEVDEVNHGLENTSFLNGVHLHLKNALSKYGDRQNPDYRNSIKESISAVEALLTKLTGKRKFSDALRELEKTIEIHSSLKEGYIKIYGYTSDGDGIRHPLKDKDTVQFEDAKYMLVSCSAFINYLIEKARKAGIELK